jgi:hypothetical protein
MNRKLNGGFVVGERRLDESFIYETGSELEAGIRHSK